MDEVAVAAIHLADQRQAIAGALGDEVVAYWARLDASQMLKELVNILAYLYAQMMLHSEFESAD